MGYSSEIRGTLGMDTNSFKNDLDGARQSFKKFGQDLQNESQKTGEGAGGKLVDSLEHRLFGSGHLAGALATALGLNLETIAEKIASVIVGGTKAGMEEAIKIEERLSKALDASDDRRLTTAQKISQLEEKIRVAKKDQSELPMTGGQVTGTQYIPGVGKKEVIVQKGTYETEDDSNKKRALGAQIIEDQNKLNALKDAQKAKDAAFHEKEHTAFRAALSDEEELATLQAEVVKLGDKLLNKKATEAEIDEARIKLLEKEGALAAVQLKIDEKKIENQSKLRKALETEDSKVRDFNESQMDDAERLQAMQADLLETNKKIAQSKGDAARMAELIIERTEKELRLAKEAADVRKKETKSENKENDEDKLGLNELAQLGPHQFRVSSKTADEGAQAREVLRLKQQAEDARKLGNSDQAAELRSRSESIRGGLTSLKSSEKGLTPELTQALVPTNVILASIDKTLGNKFVNQ